MSEIGLLTGSSPWHSKTDWNIAIPISKDLFIYIVCKFGEIRYRHTPPRQSSAVQLRLLDGATAKHYDQY